jgi:hypothetical protein
MDVLVSSQHLLDRLCREEKTLKDLGMYAEVRGVRIAITILIRETQSPEPPPPLEPST